MGLKKVVITGGPSTGKTAVIKHLEEEGYTCVHELIRSMTSMEQDNSTLVTNPIVSVKNPKKFNQQLLDGRIDQYKGLANDAAKVIFYDRGIPDVHAYMNCFGQAYDGTFEQPGYTYRYDYVFLMPPWQEIYAGDNERLESFEESVRIHHFLKSTYTDFGYEVIPVPKVSIEERTKYILDFLDLD